MITLELRPDELDFINLLLENNECTHCGPGPNRKPDCIACQLYVELCEKTGALIPENCV